MMTYFCCDQRRRNAVRAHDTLNGIDFLDVEDDETMPDAARQRRLFVHFVKPLAAPPDPAALTAANIRISGGEVRTDLAVVDLTVDGRVATVELDAPGDFAPYTLALVASPGADQPPDGFDPLLARVEFSFKVNCPSDFDCDPDESCPPPVREEPDLNYLARDFNSFRRLMLDRLGALAPAWQEENVADLLHALVDLKAYLADSQSYQLDAVATEAYLHTARSRISVRRHARLVDYPMHDGCNARAWITVQLQEKLDPETPVPLPAGTQLFTRTPGVPRRIGPDTPEYRDALEAAPEFFETMAPATLYRAHQELCFYTWGDGRCCLPVGATRATLTGHLAHLVEGDVLIFQEIRGPETGKGPDADPTHRCAVRLVEVRYGEDPLPEPPQPVTYIRWHVEDALPFPLCISADVPPDPAVASSCAEAISVARGNVVLADHGRTLDEAELGTAPPVPFYYAEAHAHCEETPPREVPPRFRPRLVEGPVSQATRLSPLFSVDADPALESDLDDSALPARLANGIRSRRIVVADLYVEPRGSGVWVVRNGPESYLVRKESTPDAGDKLAVYDPPSATAALAPRPEQALPALTLTNAPGDTPPRWQPRRDLLNSNATAREFVAEVEAGGATRLRFGDDRFGKRPESGDRFWLIQRLGNGNAGNVGAEAVRHIVSDQGAITGVENLLPATGGRDPERMETVRRAAPHAYRTQERAVTPEDYAAVAQRHPQVQRAAATFRWTGSWYTVYLTVDRKGGLPVDTAFEERLLAHMERYRMAGYDLEIAAPHFVSLEIEMTVCVLPDYFRSQVEAALRTRFSSRRRQDGALGLFHPDRLTFGQTVHLSELVAAAETVAGVDWVEVTRFQRQGDPTSSGLATGQLTMGRLEIPRLESDPNYPKRGLLQLVMKGGK